jgi:hypothetical protein
MRSGALLSPASLVISPQVISIISPSPQETRGTETANIAATRGMPMLTKRLFIKISHNPDYSICNIQFFFEKNMKMAKKQKKRIFFAFYHKKTQTLIRL